MTLRRGALVILEGCDRSGKTTQAGMLVDALNAKNVPAKLLKFPNRNTVIGGMINSYLKQSCDMDDRAIHLLFSANRWEAMKSMEKDLHDGITLVVDRYAYSGVAFSAAKGLDMQWCKSCDRGLLTPDAVFYLHLTADKMVERGGFGDERYETKEIQTRVQSIFNNWAQTDPLWKSVDASGTVEHVHRDLLSKVESAINNCVFEDGLKHSLFH